MRMQEIKRGSKKDLEVARKYKRRQEQFREWKIAQKVTKKTKDIVLYMSLQWMVL
jgi:hypothetical protein